MNHEHTFVKHKYPYQYNKHLTMTHQHIIVNHKYPNQYDKHLSMTHQHIAVNNEYPERLNKHMTVIYKHILLNNTGTILTYDKCPMTCDKIATSVEVMSVLCKDSSVSYNNTPVSVVKTCELYQGRFLTKSRSSELYGETCDVSGGLFIVYNGMPASYGSFYNVVGGTFLSQNTSPVSYIQTLVGYGRAAVYNFGLFMEYEGMSMDERIGFVMYGSQSAVYEGSLEVYR